MGLSHLLHGCSDASALNYDELVNTDDGSCIPYVFGCGINSFNYNSLANIDDDSCEAVVEGCTDSTAFNYSEFANTDMIPVSQ